MTGRHRDLMVCSLFSLGLYLVISPVLIAKYGVTGAAVAFAIQIIVQNVMVTARVKQTTGLWTTPLCSWRAAREEFRRLKHARRDKVNRVEADLADDIAAVGEAPIQP